ncbi:hypothetical protein PC129_g12581 [Phytophthora cactorum]|uniref:Uncharacterized protein n=1 Tax=Phytophthora cactorum TaxID=29920 RepID=A0A329SY65_9STRA|nr:hypothetical protein PC112_g15976 [Phytophthora cactorum]KAG2812033.1 hypothetical protein PC111_g14968 [Phytophthora cactorum]KAG2868020.1 hypothetical protein PC113_g1520 [Phytophthora cactorum]KAG2890173.1 hypothetical protein PC114_g17600 [Phytophthora cactorum]KAG2918901.1 hypothetical protein PC117_g16922 [Phytophthora cactorum]
MHAHHIAILLKLLAIESEVKEMRRKIEIRLEEVKLECERNVDEKMQEVRREMLLQVPLLVTILVDREKQLLEKQIAEDVHHPG